MRPFFLLLLLLASVFTHAQTEGTTTLYFPEVGWSIAVPNKFQMLDSALARQMQMRGFKAISEAYNQPINAIPYTTLLAIRPSLTNYIDAVLNPFDPKVDGDWNESSSKVHQIVTYTFQQKAPEAKIDTATTQEKIGGINFKRFTLNLELPGNNGTLKMLMYTALIRGYDFAVNILYVTKDEAIGKEFLDMWRKSEFNLRFTPPKIKPN